MKPITEQERKDLISHGNNLKGRIEQWGHRSEFESKTLRLVEIALASLTAQRVGYYGDSENAQRREWLARGAETVVSRLENGVVGADKYEGVCASIKIGRVTINEIRSGEVDL